MISLYQLILIPAAAQQILRTFRTFNRGMVLEIFGAHLFGPDLDDEKTPSQRGGNGWFLRHFAST